jgi:hypothetical protein
MKNNLIPLDKWPSSLPLEIAHYESAQGIPLYTLDEIANHFGVTPEHLERYRELPAFRAEVRACIQELQDTNSLIRRKVRKQAEYYFDHLVPKWLSDEDWPPSEKVKILTLLAKTAKVIDDPADKARAEAEAAAKNPQTQSTPTLTLILQSPQGQQVSGMTFNQPAERVIDAE